MSILGIIPARYGSTRFPGKPLANIAGKSMIQRVYEQVAKAKSLSDIVVATDDVRIEDHVKGFGGKVVMTSDLHPTGTDRCFEALNKTEGNFDVVINIQGDEPLIDPEQIDKVAQCFEKEDTQIATLVRLIQSEDVLKSPNTAKTILDPNNKVLFFSRSPIPYMRGKNISEWIALHDYYHHIGIYGYRKNVLAEITRLEPSTLEKVESLEQLRWLENGYSIYAALTDHDAFSVDIPQDVATIIRLLEED